MANYQSQFTGEQIDTAIGKVDGKLDKTGGTLSGNLLPQSYGTYTLGTTAYPFSLVCAKNGVFASLMPDNTSSNIGGSSNPFYNAHFNNMYATYGAFTTLRVNSQDVWHEGNLQIAIGTVSITPSGATTPASKVVSFGKTFSAPPKVILTATNSEKAHVFSWSTSNITTTQFTAHVSNSVGAYPSHANWIAIGI